MAIAALRAPSSKSKGLWSKACRGPTVAFEYCGMGPFDSRRVSSPIAFISCQPGRHCRENEATSW
eukprot:2936529-Prymnesium_polylepis.2